MFFNFNSKYLFLFFLDKDVEDEIYFVINDPILQKKLRVQYGDHFISTRTVKGILRACRAKVWVSSVLETPYFQVIRNRRRIVYHIGHGVPLKKIILDEERISLVRKINRFLRSRSFTHVLAYSTEFQPVMEKAFKNKKLQYVHMGQPRNDTLELYSKEEQLERIKEHYPELPKHEQAILYAPTWRSYDTVQFFPFNQMSASELNTELQKNKTVLFLRKHPYFPSLLEDEYLKQSNIFLFDSDLFPEIMDYLSYFDKLITDYSSIYLDFLCLNRPMAFAPYDLLKYTAHTGFTMPYQKLTPGDYLVTKDDFYTFISNKNERLGKKRSELVQLVNAKVCGNCAEHYAFIKSLL